MENTESIDIKNPENLDIKNSENLDIKNPENLDVQYPKYFHKSIKYFVIYYGQSFYCRSLKDICEKTGMNISKVRRIVYNQNKYTTKRGFEIKANIFICRPFTTIV